MVRGRLRNFVNVAVARAIVELPMLVRVAVVCALRGWGLHRRSPRSSSRNRRSAFVVGKLFSYTCFDGTAGMGRIFPDGSVVGTIRPGGQEPGAFRGAAGRHHQASAANAMCAHLAGLPFEPCFRVQKIDYRSFRGSISGLASPIAISTSAIRASRLAQRPASSATLRRRRDRRHAVATARPSDD